MSVDVPGQKRRKNSSVPVTRPTLFFSTRPQFSHPLPTPRPPILYTVHRFKNHEFVVHVSEPILTGHGPKVTTRTLTTTRELQSVLLRTVLNPRPVEASADGFALSLSHPVSLGNEVKSESSWRWSYGSGGSGGHHQAFHRNVSRQESALNVTSFYSRHRSQHHVSHNSTRHRSKQHDVSHSSWRGQQYHYTSSSYRRQASSFRQSHRVSELRQGAVTHASGAGALRKLKNHSRHSTSRGSSTVSSLQVIICRKYPPPLCVSVPLLHRPFSPPREMKYCGHLN